MFRRFVEILDDIKKKKVQVFRIKWCSELGGFTLYHPHKKIYGGLHFSLITFLYREKWFLSHFYTTHGGLYVEYCIKYYPLIHRSWINNSWLALFWFKPLFEKFLALKWKVLKNAFGTPTLKSYRTANTQPKIIINSSFWRKQIAKFFLAFTFIKKYHC